MHTWKQGRISRTAWKVSLSIMVCLIAGDSAAETLHPHSSLELAGGQIAERLSLLQLVFALSLLLFSAGWVLLALRSERKAAQRAKTTSPN